MGTLFDHVVAVGNRPWRLLPAAQRENWITCADGFKISVLAGDGTCCMPDDSGPYTAVEVGFPSERPEPWDQWSKFANSRGAPTDIIYNYVPVELVRALIESHGGAS